MPYVLALILIGTTAWLVHRGWDFYRLSMEERVEHPDYKQLKSTGVIGNGYGYAAALLVILNLSYLVRRRLARFRLGSMRVWLDVHVFTGLLAALLASFHSAFLLRTPIAKASAASLAIVVLTGLIGRFIQYLVPPFDPTRVRRAYDELDAVLPGAAGPASHGIDALPAPVVAADASLLRALAAVPRWRRCARLRAEVIDHLVEDRRALTRPQRGALTNLRRAIVAEARASGVAALVRSWRGLHRFAAFLMLLVVALHAGVAWHYGYRWIFG